MKLTSRFWTQVTRYGVALGAVGLAAGGRLSVTPIWGPTQLPYTFFFFAVILVAWWARLGPALLALLSGLLLANWLFVHPGHWIANQPGDLTRVLAFAASSLAAIIAIEAIHRANARALAEVAERRRSEEKLAALARRQETLYRFVDVLQRAETLEALYDATLDAIVAALRCDRASLLLLDPDGLMRFVGWRGLSDAYRRGVEGHSPWTPDSRDPTPVRIEDVNTADMDEGLRATVRAEGLRALAFIPLVANGRIIGKFMSYYDAPHVWSDEEMDLALAIGRQLAFGIARKRAEHALRDSEQRLEQAMAAGRMGAWEWDLRTGRVIWSPGLERMHGIPTGSFGGTLEDFRRDMHPEDAERVSQGIQQALATRSEYHMSYRIQRLDGTPRWVEAFGRMSLGDDGEPWRLSGVCMDITERRGAEAEREQLLDREHRLRQAAEEANRVKDEFLATLSHELRNPLNAILGYSELLIRTCETENLRALRPIGEALKRNSLIQSNLIRDLLDLSKLRSGKVELKIETCDLVEATRNAVETVLAETTVKDIAIEIESSRERLFARADLLRFEQVAWNLLNNAVKFTPPRGRITIRLRQEDNEIVLTMEDTGQGIAPEFLPHIFEMFRQADASTTRAHSGMGIGLALVRQLVELQGGTVSAYSAGPDQGAQFTVRLPAGAEEERVARPKPPASSGNLAGMRILVVDDSEDTADMLERLLESEGATVSTAHGGAEALAVAAGNTWDVVLSDISMPVMDGFEFLGRFRQLPGGEDAPVLALTGYGQAQDIQRAQAAGFVSHMTKPVDLGVLLEFLRKLHRSGPSRPTASTSAARTP